MAKDEKTGKAVGTIASKAMRGGKLTPKETRSLGASALNQRPDKGGSKGSGGKGSRGGRGR